MICLTCNNWNLLVGGCMIGHSSDTCLRKQLKDAEKRIFNEYRMFTMKKDGLDKLKEIIESIENDEIIIEDIDTSDENGNVRINYTLRKVEKSFREIWESQSKKKVLDYFGKYYIKCDFDSEILIVSYDISWGKFDTPHDDLDLDVFAVSDNMIILNMRKFREVYWE